MAATVLVPMNAMSGTPDQPITVRAQNERRAFLRGEGGGAPIELSACSNWVVEGLRAEGADVAGEMGDEPGSVVVLARACGNVVLRRLLAGHPNRYLQASVYVLAHAAANVVVEECEALDYHYYGFHAYDSQHPIFRRDYAHSRDVADLARAASRRPPSRRATGASCSRSRRAASSRTASPSASTTASRSRAAARLRVGACSPSTTRSSARSPTRRRTRAS